MQSHDVDIEEEIFSLLASLSKYINTDDLYGVLMDLAIVSLNEESNFTKVANLVEKISREPFQEVVCGLTSFASSKLLSLVWSVYKNPNFEHLKNSSVIQDFLSKCLTLPSGRPIALQSVRECMAQLESFSSNISDSSLSSIASVETTSARVVHTIRFLISKNISIEGIRELEQEGLIDRLVSEISRFLTANRSRYLSGSVDKKWYQDEIFKRLEVIRSFYGINMTMRIPIILIDTLWQLLSTVPEELEVYFMMLKQGMRLDSSIGDYPEFLHIYQNIICNPTIDWSLCGEEAYSCFETYFQGLETILRGLSLLPSQRPPHLGLDTLWKIAFYIPVSATQKVSVDLLLKSYEDMYMTKADVHMDFINRVFEQMNDSTAKLTSTNPKEVATQKKLISRCVDILHAALFKSKSPSEPSHAMRGCMSRIKVIVHFKRVVNSLNYSNQMNSFRTEKGTEITLNLDVHPMQTVLQLKMKIAVAVNLGTAAHKVYFENALKGAFDSR
jgi:hypothetical protein